jgi:hypothetical protein
VSVRASSPKLPHITVPLLPEHLHSDRQLQVAGWHLGWMALLY